MPPVTNPANTWPVQDAKAHFSELLRASLTSGPQIVTFRGAEPAVLLPVAEWRRLQQQSQSGLKSLLLDASPLELAVTPRGRLRRRPVRSGTAV